MISKKSTFGIITSVVLAASMWFYVDRVLVPHQVPDAAAHDEPRGNLSDLYPRWLGARELLLHGRDPYSADVTREIQAGYYGRPLNPARANDPKDQQGFAYPVYVTFLLAPTVHLPFSTVRRSFYCLLWFLTGASVLLWLRTLRWSPPLATKVMLVILTLGTFAAAQGLKLQQLSLLVGALLAASLLSVTVGYLSLSGVLLGFATIKPQIAWIPALWLSCWALRDWHRRQKFIWGFAITMGALLAGAEIILPGWTSKFYVAIGQYREYTHNMPLLERLTNQLIGASLSGMLIVVTGIWSWSHLKDEANTRGFAVTAGLIMALTVVVIPMFAPYNQVLFLPAVFLIVRDARRLWRSKRAIRILFAITACLLFGPWMATLGITLASAFLPASVVQRAWAVPLYTNFGFPLALFALLGVATPVILQSPEERPQSPLATDPANETTV